MMPFSRPMLRAEPLGPEAVDQPARDRGAGERDRHRQEDQRLGDRLAAAEPVGERGEGEADAHGDERNERRSTRPCCGSTRSMLLVGEDEPVVVQADEARRPRESLKLMQERVEHRVDEEHAEDHEARARRRRRAGPPPGSRPGSQSTTWFIAQNRKKTPPTPIDDRDADDQEAGWRPRRAGSRTRTAGRRTATTTSDQRRRSRRSRRRAGLDGRADDLGGPTSPARSVVALTPRSSSAAPSANGRERPLAAAPRPATTVRIAGYDVGQLASMSSRTPGASRARPACTSPCRSRSSPTRPPPASGPRRRSRPVPLFERRRSGPPRRRRGSAFA